MKFITKISLVLISALAYYLIFYANKIIFESLEFSYGVNWIFIPSGIQLLLVLILIGEGALGIVLASFIIGLENYYLDSVIRTFITALISGLAPLISRKICFDFLGIEKELLNITTKSIIQMSIVFAFVSASLHQLWFFYNGKSESFTHNLFVMAVGNLIGTTLVLFSLSIVSLMVKKNKSLNE
jgi:hypothetical protein